MFASVGCHHDPEIEKHRPPDAITHYGYGGGNSSTFFTPIQVD